MTTKAKNTDTRKRKTYSAPALEKGLDILELLSTEAEGLSISEIVTRLDRSVGELFRMLVVLEQRGYVSIPEGSDKYVLSLKLFGMAHRFPPVKRLTTIARPIMHKLAFEIEQSCHLVIYYEGRGHVLVQEDSPSARIFSVRLGAEAPLLSTCSGHVLLAFSDDQQRAQMVKKIPKLTSAQEKEIQKVTKRVRKQGYEIIKSSQTLGVQDIGYPVFDYTDNIVAALVVPFVEYLDGSHSIGIDAVRKFVESAALELSASLGYQL